MKKKVLVLIAKESQFVKKINNFKYVYIFIFIICFYVYICVHVTVTRIIIIHL